ncbi:MAG: endolytic transglycosylase MltG, partial [Methylophilaceae bacterium]
MTFVEGQTMQQIFNLIKKNPNIKQTVGEFDEEKILKLMNVEAKSLEGLVYADTYYFTKNTTDIELLKTAHSHLDKKLKLAWNHRQQNLPYNNQYEALI